MLGLFFPISIGFSSERELVPKDTDRFNCAVLERLCSMRYFCTLFLFLLLCLTDAAASNTTGCLGTVLRWTLNSEQANPHVFFHESTLDGGAFSEEFKTQVVTHLRDARKILGNLVVPTNIMIRSGHSPIYSFGAITLPRGNLSAAILLHEFGHMVLEFNFYNYLSKRFGSECGELLKHRWEIRKQLKTLYYENYYPLTRKRGSIYSRVYQLPDSHPERQQLKVVEAAIDEMKKRYDELVEQHDGIEQKIESIMAKHKYQVAVPIGRGVPHLGMSVSSIEAYHELFADLVADLALNDPSATRKCLILECDPSIRERPDIVEAYRHRDFAGRIELNDWKWQSWNPPHMTMAPTRSFIGDHYFGNPKFSGRKARILEGVYNVILRETERIATLQMADVADQTKLNADFIAALKQEFGFP